MTKLVFRRNGEDRTMDAVDQAGITAFYASTSSEPAQQLILVVGPQRLLGPSMCYSMGYGGDS